MPARPPTPVAWTPPWDPAETPIVVVVPPHILQQRRAFADLTPDERIDEIERHTWAMEDASRPRTIHSEALLSMGFGVEILERRMRGSHG